MNKGDIVKPKEFDHKSKMRLIEHGEEWEVESSQIRLEGVVKFVLLRSIATNYFKWWKFDYAN